MKILNIIQNIYKALLIFYIIIIIMLNDIIKRFPLFKLSYDNLIHNKVNIYNYCIAIPKGQKFLAWFTYYEDKNICVFLEINRKKEILSYKYFPLCFNKELSLNTILYGTIINNNNQRRYLGVKLK